MRVLENFMLFVELKIVIIELVLEYDFWFPRKGKGGGKKAGRFECR